MRRGLLLLDMLLMAFAAHGRGAEGLDPWRGWVVFKAFARAAAESPDPGVSVQIAAAPGAATASLIFVRQVVEVTPERLEPVGGVVCELTFPIGARAVAEWEAWSFDSGSFDRFVDLVEGSPQFQELVVQRPVRSDAYWLEA